MIRYLFIFWVALICATAQAGTITEVPPAPTLPVYGKTVQVPENAAHQSNCAGVSEAGIAGCTSKFSWRTKVGRYWANYYRNLAIAYNVNTGAVTALRPIQGDTDTVVNGVTPGGRIWGQSMYGLFGVTSKIVEWDATGTPTLLGMGKATAADDLGRIAIFNQLCDASGCVTPANVYEILALSNSGDYLAVYVEFDAEGTEHAGLWRASDYAAREPEDFCGGACLADLGASPMRAALNSAGVAVWSGSAAGFVAAPGLDSVYYDAPLAWVSEIGVSVGGSQIIRADGTIEPIPLGIYSDMRALGINSSGGIVGESKSGAYWSAFVYVQ